DERVHLLDVALLDPVLGFEVFDLAGDADGELGSIKLGYRTYAGASRCQRVPVFLDAGSERRHESQPGYHHSAIQDSSHRSPLSSLGIALHHLLKRGDGKVCGGQRRLWTSQLESLSAQVKQFDRAVEPCTGGRLPQTRRKPGRT